MTIRYATGTYTTPQSLLESLDSFIVTTLGWTRNLGPTTVSGKSGKRAHYQKAITKNGVTRTVYWNILAPGADEVQGTSSDETYMQALFSYPSTGYAAELAWDRQPGYPVASTGTLGLFPASSIPLTCDPPLRYVFSGNIHGDVYVVYERVANSYNAAIYAGVLDKSVSGQYIGGEYAGAASSYVSSWINTQRSELPWDSGSYAGIQCLVRATVDGITDWVCIPQQYSSTAELNRKTSLVGIGNVSASTALNTVTAIPAIPNVSRTTPSLNSMNGIIVDRELQCAVRRTASKFSMLGTMPLVKYCAAVADNGVPWGTILNNKFYTRYLSVELRDE